MFFTVAQIQILKAMERPTFSQNTLQQQGQYRQQVGNIYYVPIARQQMAAPALNKCTIPIQPPGKIYGKQTLQIKQMKKHLTAISLCITLFATAQKDTAGIKKDSVKIFYLVLPEDNWMQLLQLIKSVDEKPSVIKQWIDLILANIRELKPEAKTDNKKK